MTKAPGHPAEENSVGLSSGLVMALSSDISLAESLKPNASALTLTPSAHLLPSRQALVPSPNSVVGRTLTAAPVCKTQRRATSSGVFWAPSFIIINYIKNNVTTTSSS